MPGPTGAAETTDAHRKIINYMKQLKLRANTEGICYGLAFMGAQAILAKKISSFDIRHKILLEIDESDLAETIRLLRQKKIGGETLTADELKVLEVAAFLEGIEINHHGFPIYRNMFSTQKKHLGPENQNVLLTSPLTLPTVLEAIGGVERVSAFSGTYYQQGESYFSDDEDNELTQYFKTLLDSVEKNHFKEPIALFLGSVDHAITAGYDPTKKEWYLIDANKLPTIITPRGKERDIANQIISSFSESHYTTFTTEVFCGAEHAQKLKAVVTDWKNTEAWQEMHAPSGKKRSPEAATALLEEAIKLGDLHTTRELLKHVNPNYKNKQGYTPLIIAARTGHADIAKELLRNKADPTQKTTATKHTALFIAAKNGHADVLQALIDHNCDYNATDDDGYSPMMIAVKFGQLNVVKKFLALNVDPNQKSGSSSLLCMAAREGKIDIIRELLLNGAKLNTNSRGRSPIEIAEANGYHEIANELRQHANDPDYKQTIKTLIKDANQYKLSYLINDPSTLISVLLDNKNMYKRDFTILDMVGELFRTIQTEEEREIFLNKLNAASVPDFIYSGTDLRAFLAWAPADRRLEILMGFEASWLRKYMSEADDITDLFNRLPEASERIKLVKHLMSHGNEQPTPKIWLQNIVTSQSNLDSRHPPKTLSELTTDWGVDKTLIAVLAAKSPAAEQEKKTKQPEWKDDSYTETNTKRSNLQKLWLLVQAYQDNHLSDTTALRKTQSLKLDPQIPFNKENMGKIAYIIKNDPFIKDITLDNANISGEHAADFIDALSDSSAKSITIQAGFSQLKDLVKLLTTLKDKKIKISLSHLLSEIDLFDENNNPTPNAVSLNALRKEYGQLLTFNKHTIKTLDLVQHKSVSKKYADIKEFLKSDIHGDLKKLIDLDQLKQLLDYSLDKNIPDELQEKARKKLQDIDEISIKSRIHPAKKIRTLTTMAEVIEKHPNLEKFTLMQNALTSEEANILATALAKNTQLASIELGGGFGTLEDISTLLDKLSSNSNMKKIRLSSPTSLQRLFKNGEPGEDGFRLLALRNKYKNLFLDDKTNEVLDKIELIVNAKNTRANQMPAQPAAENTKEPNSTDIAGILKNISLLVKAINNHYEENKDPQAVYEKIRPLTQLSMQLDNIIFYSQESASFKTKALEILARLTGSVKKSAKSFRNLADVYSMDRLIRINTERLKELGTVLQPIIDRPHQTNETNEHESEHDKEYHSESKNEKDQTHEEDKYQDDNRLIYNNTEDFYRILNVTPENVKQAYAEGNGKFISKAFNKMSVTGTHRHPDKGGDVEKFKTLNWAKEVLSDNELREVYNDRRNEYLKQQKATVEKPACNDPSPSAATPDSAAPIANTTSEPLDRPPPTDPNSHSETAKKSTFNYADLQVDIADNEEFIAGYESDPHEIRPPRSDTSTSASEQVNYEKEHAEQHDPTYHARTTHQSSSGSNSQSINIHNDDYAMDADDLIQRISQSIDALSTIKNENYAHLDAQLNMSGEISILIDSLLYDMENLHILWERDGENTTSLRNLIAATRTLQKNTVRLDNLFENLEIQKDKVGIAEKITAAIEQAFDFIQANLATENTLLKEMLNPKTSKKIDYQQSTPNKHPREKAKNLLQKLKEIPDGDYLDQTIRINTAHQTTHLAQQLMTALYQTRDALLRKNISTIDIDETIKDASALEITLDRMENLCNNFQQKEDIIESAISEAINFKAKGITLIQKGLEKTTKEPVPAYTTKKFYDKHRRDTPAGDNPELSISPSTSHSSFNDSSSISNRGRGLFGCTHQATPKAKRFTAIDLPTRAKLPDNFRLETRIASLLTNDKFYNSFTSRNEWIDDNQFIACVAPAEKNGLYQIYHPRDLIEHYNAAKRTGQTKDASTFKDRNTNKLVDIQQVFVISAKQLKDYACTSRMDTHTRHKRPQSNKSSR